MSGKPPKDDGDPDIAATKPKRPAQPERNPSFTFQPASPPRSPALSPTWTPGHSHSASVPIRPDSPAAALKKEKGRVRFNSTTESGAPDPFSDPATAGSSASVSASSSSRQSPIQRPRPSLSHLDLATGEPGPDSAALAAQERAQARARHVAENVRRPSPSPHRASTSDPLPSPLGEGDGYISDIPMQEFSSTSGWQKVASNEEKKEDTGLTTNDEAMHLVRAHTFYKSEPDRSKEIAQEEMGKVASNGGADKDISLSYANNAAYDGLYEVAEPKTTHGLFTEILKLYKTAGEPAMNSKHPHIRAGSFGSTPGDRTPLTADSPSGTGFNSPKRKWYDSNRSQETLINLVGASAKLANPSDGKGDKGGKKDGKRPSMGKRTTSASRLATMLTARQEEEHRVHVNIANILARQEYIVKLCRALMIFGAPTHRLEEYLSTSANLLEIAGQFLYLPGCMIISFDDKTTHTTEVRMVRSAQAIDLGKLKDVHHIYKEVMHDVISADEGRQRLEDLLLRKDKFSAWMRVLVHGLTSATAATFSFSARPIDLPLLFCFGCTVGWLQLIVASQYQLYSNVFEISATVLVSFLARAFGSITVNGEPLFCFSALAQGGIVMLLPGYSVLCSALELQSRAIIPGSIRMVYAIIYSLFLGFGITVGSLFYGLIDSNATSATTCSDPLNSYVTFAFVPGFVLCICMLYQAKWRQMPVMLVVAFAGYVVNHFAAKRFTVAPQIANTFGAFTVGVLANLYSRVRHGVAAATLIPAIFTQVPGGLASNGGLIGGLRLANEVTNSNSSSSTDSSEVTAGLNTVVFNLAANMIQIAIGIAVGLFLSALIIYPLGKRRSGLFSF